MSHTPGPWLREGNSIYALQQDGWRKGKPVMVNRFYVQVQLGRAHGELTPHTEIEANARLIAVAPELLAIAELALPMIAKYGSKEQFVQALQTVAKAKNDPADSPLSKQ